MSELLADATEVTIAEMSHIYVASEWHSHTSEKTYLWKGNIKSNDRCAKDDCIARRGRKTKLLESESDFRVK